MQRNNFQCFWNFEPAGNPTEVVGKCCAKGNGWISWGVGPGPSSQAVFYSLSATQAGECTGHQDVTCTGAIDDGTFAYDGTDGPDYQIMSFTRPFAAGEHTISIDEEQVWHYGINSGSQDIEAEHSGAYGGSRLIPTHPNPPSSLGGGGSLDVFGDVGTFMLVVAGGLSLVFVVVGGGVYYQKKQEQANLWSEHGQYSSYGGSMGGSSMGGSSWAGTNENPYSSGRSHGSSRGKRSHGSRGRGSSKGRSHGSSHGKRSHGKRSHGSRHR